MSGIHGNADGLATHRDSADEAIAGVYRNRFDAVDALAVDYLVPVAAVFGEQVELEQ